MNTEIAVNIKGFLAEPWKKANKIYSKEGNTLKYKESYKNFDQNL